MVNLVSKRFIVSLLLIAILYLLTYKNMSADSGHFNVIYIRVDFIYKSNIRVDWIRVENNTSQIDVYERDIKGVFLYIDAFTPLKFSGVKFPSGRTIFKPREIILSPKYLYINISKSREYGVYKIFFEESLSKNIFDVILFSNQSIKYNITLEPKSSKMLYVSFNTDIYEIYSLNLRMFSFTEIGNIDIIEPHFLNSSRVMEINVPGYGKYYTNMNSYIVFGDKITIVNNDDKQIKLLLNIAPIFKLKNVYLYTSKNIIRIKVPIKDSGELYLYINLPQFFKLANLTEYNRTDPLTKLYIPSKFFFRKIREDSREFSIKIFLEDILIRIYNSQGKELNKGFITIFYPNGSIYRNHISNKIVLTPSFPPVFRIRVSLDDFQSPNITIVGFKENVAEIYVNMHDLLLTIMDVKYRGLGLLKVKVFSFESLLSYTFYTDENGRVTIENLVEGNEYMIRVFHHGIEIKRMVINFTRNLNQIRLKCPIDDFKIYVRNPSGIPLNGINVTINGNKGITLSNITDSMGKVLFKNIIYDTYNVTIYSSGIPVFSKKLSFNGEDNPIISVNVYKYIVLVRDYWGNPLENCTIYLVGENGLNIKKISDDRGQAIFKWIPQGNYSIKIVLPFIKDKIVKNISIPGYGYNIFKTDIVFHYENIVISIDELYIGFGIFLIISFSIIFIKSRDKELIFQ